MNKIILIAFVLILATGCLPVVEEVKLDESDFDVTGIVNVDEIKQNPIEVPKEEKEDEELEDRPSRLNHEVKFASQAPHSNWDMPYQEACEEAALIQAYKYFYQEDLTPDIMDQEILKLVEWEKQNLGVMSDTDLVEVKRIAEEYFNLNVEIDEEVSEEHIKDLLAKGYLILVPTAGRELGNPNFKQPGPLYHFLVVRGYDWNDFITNDLGTRKGDGYKYKYKTLINAIHDLPLKDDGSVFRPYDEEMDDLEKEKKMLTGKKKILVIKG